MVTSVATSDTDVSNVSSLSVVGVLFNIRAVIFSVHQSTEPRDAFDTEKMVLHRGIDKWVGDWVNESDYDGREIQCNRCDLKPQSRAMSVK